MYPFSPITYSVHIILYIY